MIAEMFGKLGMERCQMSDVEDDEMQPKWM